MATLRKLNLLTKSFVIPFVDIGLTFFDCSFNSYLFDVTSFSLLSNSALFSKLAISLLPAKFARFSFKSHISAVNLSNSGVIVYLSWLWSVIFFSISLVFVF